MNQTIVIEVTRLDMLAILTGKRGVGGVLTGTPPEHDRTEDFRSRAAAANLAVQARNNGTYDASRHQRVVREVNGTFRGVVETFATGYDWADASPYCEVDGDRTSVLGNHGLMTSSCHKSRLFVRVS